MLFLFYFLSYETVLKVQCSLQIGKYQFPPESQSLSSRERTKKSYCAHYQSKGLLTIVDGLLIPTRQKKKKKKAFREIEASLNSLL